MQKVMISTLWEANVVPIAIYKLTPSKVILITDDNPKRKKASSSLKKQFPNIRFDSVKVHEFDVPEITKKILEAANKEEGNEVYIHVTEGRKTMFLGGIFAASMLKDKTKGAFYLREDNNELMHVPLMEFRISDTKAKILKELSRGNRKVADITKKADVHRSLVYAAIKDMIGSGLLTADWKLTDAGKIAVM